MDHSRASKVLIESSFSEPSSFVPGPVRHGGVDPARQDDGVGEVSEKLASLGNGPGHNCGSCGSEHELEEPRGILLMVQLVAEELRAPTKNVATIAISQAPSNGPIGDA